MGSKIYVGGLPYSTTEQELSDLFGQHGSVQSAKVITDKYTGQSRGFGSIRSYWLTGRMTIQGSG